MKKLILFIVVIVLVACEQQPSDRMELTKGISKELAVYRKTQIADVKYKLFFDIPERKADSIAAQLDMELSLNDVSQPLVLDFKSNRSNPTTAIVNDQAIKLIYENEHLVVPSRYLKLGQNQVQIDFWAGEMSLNRNDDYLYTLLVPDRARTLFPCFDQPDIKAIYQLKVSVPAVWEVLCGAPQTNVETHKNATGQVTTKTLTFGATDKMSTYLFSFVAGEFEVVQSEGHRFDMVLYHHEKDSNKVQLSTAPIFELHQQSVDYLEAYTQYKFPFQKLDYASIYSHPYGGMEHTGAIQYRESLMFLDNSATEKQKLRRAKLIAHETAHMWFGNLVTMNWFNDVWLKEVFANFMADKIVNPQFEEINHDLAFFVDHYPSAYDIDRSAGANPIRQDLGNLNNAGSLYGNIIYHKAPIMMRQLEAIIGQDNFQQGMIEYVKKFENDNADWRDLVDILDKTTALDLKAWSNVWVNSPRRPIVEANIVYDGKEHIDSFVLTQQAEDKTSHIWPQVFEVTLVYADSMHSINVALNEQENVVSRAKGLPKPDYIIYNSNGFGYGIFPVEENMLLAVNTLSDEVARASIYANSYESALSGRLPVDKAFDIIHTGLLEEQNELILAMLSDQAIHLFWKYLGEEDRITRQIQLTGDLFERLNGGEAPGIKKTLFDTFEAFAYQGKAREQLYKIWSKKLFLPNLVLNQEDFTKLAMNLILYEHKKASQILVAAREAIKEPNKIKRFDFLQAALSEDKDTRQRFFASFTDKHNREKENWVLSACYYVHHPLRQKTAVGSLGLSLELIEEIQETGDIFFPKAWLNNTIGMYTSKEAYGILTNFLESNPRLNAQLRLKILQATDDLSKANQ